MRPVVWRAGGAAGCGVAGCGAARAVRCDLVSTSSPGPGLDPETKSTLPAGRRLLHRMEDGEDIHRIGLWDVGGPASEHGVGMGFSTASSVRTVSTASAASAGLAIAPGPVASAGPATAPGSAPSAPSPALITLTRPRITAAPAFATSARVPAIAHQQGGVFTAAQARAEGWTSRMVRRRIVARRVGIRGRPGAG